MNIDPDHLPALLPWLREAAVGIEVSPSADGQWWYVLVTNGLSGHEGAASIVARCENDFHAELLAAALWALLREQRWEQT